MQKTIDNHFRLLGPTLLTLCVAAMLHAQSFPSGSTGVDGALNITAPGVTTFTTPPMGGGSVYNFTTINIASGSTLRLSGSAFPGPLYLLAQGAVTIAGTIDLSGQNGTQVSMSAQIPTIPGSGGYGGGAGAFSSNPAQPGLGPAGGKISGNSCNGGYPQNGDITANQFLVPLVGGSGGGGGSSTSGGAGGGALLIASSVSITVTGTITAHGGVGLQGPNTASGGGAGGSIRLVAPTIAGNGSITAAGGSSGNNSCGQGTNGTVRLEFFQNTFTGSVTGSEYFATPVNLFLPASTAQPLIMVTSIGGVAVPPNPTGAFTVPDVALNSSAPLAVNIQGTNIPAGTAATLYFSTENFPSQQVTSTPLAATSTPGVTTATATVTLNPGWSLGYVIATWSQ
jgi:hypothetical protein